MALIQTLTSWWSSSSQKLARIYLAENQVDRRGDYQALAAKKHYVRLWLSEMFLTKRVSWGKTQFPAVHSLVRFTFGSENVDVPSVADGSKVGLKDDGKGTLVANNFVLTPLIPFNGGVVDLSAGLAAIAGQNNFQGFIKVLGDFSALLAAPQLSVALKVAGPLAAGMQELFAVGGTHLSFHDAFTSGSRGGYVAVISASESEIKAVELTVEQDRLREQVGGKSVPFERFDHMLLRLEVIETRDDWESLTFIRDPMTKAAEALGAGREEEAKTFYRAAILAVHTADELTEADRTRAKLKLKDDFASLQHEFGVSGALAGEPWSLERSMRTAMSVDAALAVPEPSIENLMSS